MHQLVCRSTFQDPLSFFFSSCPLSSRAIRSTRSILSRKIDHKSLALDHVMCDTGSPSINPEASNGTKRVGTDHKKLPEECCNESLDGKKCEEMCATITNTLDTMVKERDRLVMWGRNSDALFKMLQENLNARKNCPLATRYFLWRPFADHGRDGCRGASHDWYLSCWSNDLLVFLADVFLLCRRDAQDAAG